MQREIRSVMFDLIEASHRTVHAAWDFRLEIEMTSCPRERLVQKQIL